jgi:hypothetical protein
MPAQDLNTASADVAYIQGYRFASDPAFYDSGNQRFIDQAGYGVDAGLNMNVGVPVFETVNTKECLRLDNTEQGQFACPIPWEGSLVMVIKPDYISGGTISRWICLFGDAVSASSNRRLSIAHNSSTRNVTFNTVGGGNISLGRADNNVVAIALGSLQNPREVKGSKDGITVTTSSSGSATSGIACQFGAALSGVRFGNLSGTAGDTTDLSATMFCRIMRLDFFSRDIFVPAVLPKLQTYLNELKTEFGAS